MKKIFISSKLEIIEFSNEDVITTSGGGVLETGGNGFTTDDAPLGQFN